MNKIEINHDDPKAFSTFFEQTLPTFVGLFGLSTKLIGLSNTVTFFSSL
jgi:hypothetical protein